MFLFYIGKDLHMLSADLLAVSQQLTSTCIQEALVGHVGEYVSLCPDKIQTFHKKKTSEGYV